MTSAAATYTRVPSVLHRSEQRARAALRRVHLRAATHPKYNAAKAGTVIGESPRGRTRVARGTTVHLTISRGPAPVPVLDVVHQSVTDAERSLRGLRFHTVVRYVAAPDITPGTVVTQKPVRGTRPRGSTVTLNVAEVPRWRTVTTFTGRDSGAVHIIGRHWRVVYTMAFRGTCNWLLFCSGPTARVVDAGTGGYVAGFGLQDGTGQVQSIARGAGSYEVKITPGSDDAAWSVQVQDLY